MFQTVLGDGTVAAVGNLIGGKVKANIDAQIFANACALRMSYVLNRTGVLIHPHTNQTVSGADHLHYYFRVKDLIAFLRHTFGKPDAVLSGSSTTDLTSKKGLLVFEVVVWHDATGHATLWDGVSCSDHCYFLEAKDLLFWALS
jgi:hypothetical protein